MTPETAHLLSQRFPLHPAIPRVLPNDWRMVQRWGDGGMYLDRSNLRVIVSTAEWDDGREWMHISASRETRLPSWDDLKRAKNIFCEHRRGYQVFATPKEHVNLHEYVLHIWIPLTGDYPLPDFAAGGTI